MAKVHTEAKRALQAHIVRLCTERPMTTEEIARECHIAPYTAGRHVRELREAGSLHLLPVPRDGKFQYRATSDQFDEDTMTVWAKDREVPLSELLTRANESVSTMATADAVRVILAWVWRHSWALASGADHLTGTVFPVTVRDYLRQAVESAKNNLAVLEQLYLLPLWDDDTSTFHKFGEIPSNEEQAMIIEAAEDLDKFLATRQ